MFRPFLSFLTLGLLTSINAGTTSDFQVNVKTEKKPWSHLEFRNDPDNFQFAIVSDRTGSVRPGVFPTALKKLNLLEPEFVITVGDLISGNRHTKKESDLHDMWDEMEGFVSHLDMPFFYLAGNHDNGSPMMQKVWKERFGVERYHFVYKNVLFMCMNAQDDASFAAIIKKDQQEWAKKVLADHPDVRWTFVFIHQPVWKYDEGTPLDEGGWSKEPQETGWAVIEEALKGRKHTAFAGHVHQYIRYKQEAPQTNYYSLATTGGGSRYRGADFGEFDHAMWVTMTDDGPKLANLVIDGIIPEDVNTPAQELFRAYVNHTAKVLSLDPYKIQIDLEFDNKMDKNFSGHLDWSSKNFGWTADMFHEHVNVTKGELYKKSVVLTYTGKPENVLPYPALEVRAKDEDNVVYPAQAKVGVTEILPYFKKHKMELNPALKKALNKHDKRVQQAARAAARKKKEATQK
ncbi:probable beta-galactosidase [Lentisphaera araneosa HTCC2155]|uniref:Probable beta-galactosidase n=1 Tax=Lentisphaera araneosa HTCC2155 TaxID=313628 RepID=A6DSF6_9BACT|nr:metallophosphoesterase [Lentisphaera araneosa]EDM25401.1 probable beta-galactosidase [Lentisphaera araneosa HTCC2155]